MVSLRDLTYQDSVQVNGETISIIDFPDIWDLSDEEIENLILQKTNINLDAPKAIGKFNDIFDVSLEYLQTELHYSLSKALKKQVWKRFSNKEDIINFFKATKNPKGVINCIIARIWYGIHQVLFNERVTEIREKTRAVYERKLKASLQINHSWDGIYKWQVELSIWDGKKRVIHFSMTERGKTPFAVVWKWTRDPDYLSIEAIGDLYGFTFTLEHKDDVPVFMQLISGLVFKRGIFEIKNKGLLDKDKIEENSEIRDDFKKRMIPAIDWEKKEESADEYQDVKIVSPRWSDDRTKNLSLEIKFTIAENTNETGLSMQWVYAYMRKIKESIRLDQTVTKSYIEEVIQEFISNLPKILLENINRINTNVEEYKRELFLDLRDKWYLDEKLDYNQHTKANIDRYLHEWIYKYFISKLERETDSPKANAVFTNKRSKKVRKIIEG